MPNFENYTFGICPHGAGIQNLKYFKAKNMHYGGESIASEDSGRTLDGVMHIYWLLRRIRKIEITMAPCTYETIQEILQIVQGQEYDIYYFDPAVGTGTMRYVYTSNSQADMYNGIVMNGLWQDFEFHAIELGGE